MFRVLMGALSRKRTFFVITKLVPLCELLAYLAKNTNQFKVRTAVPIPIVERMARANPMYLKAKVRDQAKQVEKFHLKIR